MLPPLNVPALSPRCRLDNFVFNELKSRVPKLRNIMERSDAMLARYPGGGSRFQKHVDNTARDGRESDAPASVDGLPHAPAAKETP